MAGKKEIAPVGRDEGRVLPGRGVDRLTQVDRLFIFSTGKTRQIDIVQATAKTIEALNKLSLPAGVDIKIKASSR